MRLCRFLAELHQLIGFLDRKCIQVHAVNRFIKVHCCRAQITTCSIALAQGVIAG
jgi:hypothetical protein